MHYIRSLRPPSLDKRDKLKLVLTITTDLGDSFLCPEQPVSISVGVVLAEPLVPDQHEAQVKIDDGSISWRSGMRVLKFEIQLPSRLMRRLRSDNLASTGGSTPRVRIIAARQLLEPPNIADIPFDTAGRVLGLSVPFPVPGQETCYTATREFAAPLRLRIDEEMGESIDRHVWDAGVVTTGLMSDMCKNDVDGKWRSTPRLQTILRSATPEYPLRAIELGCGVGILGIGLATAVSARLPHQSPRGVLQGDEDAADGSEAMDRPANAIPEALDLANILLTDLPDAEELTTGNIRGYQESQHASGFGGVQLGFESLDWEDGKKGVLGPQASATAWDLIIISDCTYNVDMLSALVGTLSALHTSSAGLGKLFGPKVMLATKPRHPSEKALFDLMASEGWRIVENATQPLPLLGLDPESVEIYLFGKTL
ncbi:unnamed protein product [Discula destructiva]